MFAHKSYIMRFKFYLAFFFFVCCCCSYFLFFLSEGPLAIYRRMVREGKLQQDMYQEKVASELEDLLGRLEQYEKEMEGYHV